MSLSISCPRCGEELKSRELRRTGLRCGGEGCRVTLWELAVESSRCWQPLTYMFVSEGSGEVKYVGTTKNLRNRLIQHGADDGKLVRGAGGRQPTESGDRKDPLEKTRWRKHKNVEERLKAAGVRVHVAFEATEWHHWYGAISYRGGRWSGPEWNRATPPRHEAYRIVKNGVVVTYKPPPRYEEESGRYLRTAYEGLVDRTASALSLETVKRRASSSSLMTSMSLCWHDRLESSLRTDVWRTEYLSGEFLLAGVGQLTVQREIGIGKGDRGETSESQYEKARRRLESPTGWWATLRHGACEKCSFFGYCRCAVPCGQVWELLGEPRDRRERRRAAERWWQDPWQRHGVMSEDDEAIHDLLEEAMWLDEEMKRLRESGSRVDVHWPRMNALTKAITRLREESYYGGDRAPSYGYRTLQDASRVGYLLDRDVVRLCVACRQSFSNRRELSEHKRLEH